MNMMCFVKAMAEDNDGYIPGPDKMYEIYRTADGKGFTNGIETVKTNKRLLSANEVEELTKDIKVTKPLFTRFKSGQWIHTLDGCPWGDFHKACHALTLENNEGPDYIFVNPRGRPLHILDMYPIDWYDYLKKLDDIIELAEKQPACLHTFLFGQIRGLRALIYMLWQGKTVPGHTERELKETIIDIRKMWTINVQEREHMD